MSGSPDPAPLRDLFLELFGEAQLRRFLSSLPHRELVEPDLPGQGATLGQLASDAAVILHRQRLIDAALFEALCEQSPRRRDEILAVAAAMEVEVAMPRSRPEPRSKPADAPTARPPNPPPEPVVLAAPRGGARWGLWIGLGVLGMGAVGVAMLVGLSVGQGGRPQPQDSTLLDGPRPTSTTAPAPSSGPSPAPPSAPAPAPEIDLLLAGTYESTIYLAGNASQSVMTLAPDGVGGATFATLTDLGLWYGGVIQRSGDGWVVQVTQSNDVTSLVGPIPTQISRAGSVLTFQSAAGITSWRQIQ